MSNNEQNNSIPAPNIPDNDITPDIPKDLKSFESSQASLSHKRKLDEQQLKEMKFRITVRISVLIGLFTFMLVWLVYFGYVNYKIFNKNMVNDNNIRFVFIPLISSTTIIFVSLFIGLLRGAFNSRDIKDKNILNQVLSILGKNINN